MEQCTAAGEVQWRDASTLSDENLASEGRDGHRWMAGQGGWMTDLQTAECANVETQIEPQ